MPIPDFRGTKVNGGEQVKLEFPWSVLLSIGILAAMTMVVVWDATSDLAESVDRLTAAIKTIEQKVDDGQRERNTMNTRISILEARDRDR